MTTDKLTQMAQILRDSERILIIQADNPDADSLGTALALESLLEGQGKKTRLQCSVDMPGYLRHMPGWDRVSRDVPSNFDATVIVDASTLTLLDMFKDPVTRGIVASKPVIVLDHHAVTDNPIDFATVVINNPEKSSTGELLFAIAHYMQWPVTPEAGAPMMNAILGDTQGLSNDLTTPTTYRVMAELTELGVSRPAIEELRREYGKMPTEIFRYKAELIARTEFYADGKLAVVSIPQQEINEYSPLYNPGPLIQGDTLMTAGVQLSIVLKQYDSGRVTAAIRANQAAPIAGELAGKMGGGGHAYASGFKVEDGTSYGDIKARCIEFATELLQNL